MKILLPFLFLCTSSCLSQSTAVELIGTTTAEQAANGLGFNLDASQDWQWQAAAKFGAKHARIQCSWVGVEKQTPPPKNQPANPQYVQDPNCVRALTSAARYGIHPTVLAGYGPPFHKIVTVALTRAAAAGDHSLDVSLVSGEGGDTLANIKYPYGYIGGPTGKPFTDRHSYQGAFIDGVTLRGSNNASLALASAVTTPLPAGALLPVFEVLYPPPGTSLATDPSVIAYGKYVDFLASDMAARGLSGDIELWNEPVWRGDPWDNRCFYYDDSLGRTCSTARNGWEGHQPNYGFAADLMNHKMPPGVTLTWGGTHTSGANTVLGYRMIRSSGQALVQPSPAIRREDFHPYGWEPEQTNWNMDCLIAAETSPTATLLRPANAGPCQLPGEPTDPNFISAAVADVILKQQNPSFGIGRGISETGIQPYGPGFSISMARFIVRQYLAFQADGVTPIEFFKFCAGTPRGGTSDETFSFINLPDGSSCNGTAPVVPNPNLIAISGLVTDLKPISNPPGSPYSPGTLPSVVKYQGTYPLSTVHLVGSRAGTKGDSDMFVLWQRSYTPIFMGSISGTTLTVTSMVNTGARLAVGQALSIGFPGPVITALGTGTGGVGTYILSKAAQVPSKSMSTIWTGQPEPPPGTVTVRMPPGMTVSAVKDLVTRSDVKYARSGQQVTFPVADNPVEVLADPVHH